ncbi:MAG: DUF417 family protein [Phenylobacterium sp.]|uniref:DUF417 family protein n=1 Tax=Phenylobacterium sp. TaxID=1871053 RepID=UPI001A3E0AC5|nr:DUF417 family protein [Phenylobacterium sp.]MBL8771876.1 DUF417 family protein [Phenylobacterium sp.]
MSAAISETRLTAVGGGVLRYSLVLFFLGFGLYKFTPEEAAAIAPLLENSPLLSWLYAVAGQQGASNIVGVVEIALALVVASRRFIPQVSAWGSLGVAASLVVTLSFLATTPGIDPATGGFIIKDVTLLGAALWSAGEAFGAAKARAERRAGSAPVAA